LFVKGGGNDSSLTPFAVDRGDGKVVFQVNPNGSISEVTTTYVSATSAYAGTLNLAPAQIDSTELDFTSTGGVTLSGLSTFVVGINILNPDDIYTTGNTMPFTGFEVDADKFPNGIHLESVQARQFGVTTYHLTLISCDSSAVTKSVIEPITVTGPGSTEIRGASINDRDLDAGDMVFVELESGTETWELPIKFRFIPR